MSDETFPTRGADEYYGPGGLWGTTGSNGNAFAVLTIAQNIDLYTILSNGSAVQQARGGAWFTFQPRGCDIYYRMKPTASAGGTTTGNASNGLKQAEADGKFHIWVTPKAPYMDVIASANANLYFYLSSPNYGNRP